MSFNGFSSGGDFFLDRFDTGLGTLTGVAIDLLAKAESFEEGTAPDEDGITITALASVKTGSAGLVCSDSQGATGCCTGLACFAEAIAIARVEFIGDIFPDFALVSRVGPGPFLVDVKAVGSLAKYVALTVTYPYDEPVAPVPLPAAGG